MRGSSEDKAITFPQADALWRGLLHPRKIIQSVLKMSVIPMNDTAQGIWQLSHQLPLQSHKPKTLLRQLQPGPPSFHGNPDRVAAKEILCIGCLRGCLCLQLASLSLVAPIAFHSWLLCEHLFLALVLWAKEPGLDFRPHASQGKSPHPRSPSRTSAVGSGRRASPFHDSALSTSLRVASSAISWL